jgi:hypothetical protein
VKSSAVKWNGGGSFEYCCGSYSGIEEFRLHGSYLLIQESNSPIWVCGFNQESISTKGRGNREILHCLNMMYYSVVKCVADNFDGEVSREKTVGLSGHQKTRL